jgi:hypothetical protein
MVEGVRSLHAGDDRPVLVGGVIGLMLSVLDHPAAVKGLGATTTSKTRDGISSWLDAVIRRKPNPAADIREPSRRFMR